MYCRDWSSDVCSSDLIPPAWRDVWICMDPRGHLQATGVDVSRRKQYLYHEHWRAHRDRLKFDTMVEIGRASCRERVENRTGGLAEQREAGDNQRRSIP